MIFLFVVIAKIYYTLSISDEEWQNAYYMAPITGAVLSKILNDYIVNYPIIHPRFQPFSIIEKETGKKIVKSSNSDDFIWNVFKALADLFVDVEPILVPKRYNVQLYVNNMRRDFQNIGSEKVVHDYSSNKNNNDVDDSVTAMNVGNAAAKFYQKLYSCMEAIESGDYNTFEKTEKPSSQPSTSPTLTPTSYPTNSPTVSSTTKNDEKAKAISNSTIWDQENGNSTNSTYLSSSNEDNSNADNKNNNQHQKKKKHWNVNQGDDGNKRRETKVFSFSSNKEQEEVKVNNVKEDDYYVDDDDKNDDNSNSNNGGNNNSKNNSPQSNDNPIDNNNNNKDNDDNDNDNYDNDTNKQNHYYYTDPETSNPKEKVDFVQNAENAAQEAYEAAEIAQQAAQESTNDDDTAAKAAAQAAIAAKKAAHATSEAAALSAMENIYSGDGELMTSVISTCFSDSKYGIRYDEIEKDSNGNDVVLTTTTHAYVYIDGSHYFRLNLTSPYINIARVENPLPKAKIITEGKGDFVDITLAIGIITGLIFGIYVMFHNLGLIHQGGRRMKFEWFFHPTKYSGSHKRLDNFSDDVGESCGMDDDGDEYNNGFNDNHRYRDDPEINGTRNFNHSNKNDNDNDGNNGHHKMTSSIELTRSLSQMASIDNNKGIDDHYENALT